MTLKIGGASKGVDGIFYYDRHFVISERFYWSDKFQKFVPSKRFGLNHLFGRSNQQRAQGFIYVELLLIKSHSTNIVEKLFLTEHGWGSL